MEISDKDRGKTAFCTQEGLFEFKVMLFGLCNVPATFKHLMDIVLAGAKWSTCLVYLDDIVIVGKTFHQHLANVHDWLHKLRQAGLCLKPGKCAFLLAKVNYLGHIVSERGVATNHTKTKKVATWLEPETLAEVQVFLVLASYYLQYIKNFATIAKPFHWLAVLVSASSSMDAVSKAFIPLPWKSDRSDTEVGERRESHTLRFGVCSVEKP